MVPSSRSERKQSLAPHRRFPISPWWGIGLVAAGFAYFFAVAPLWTLRTDLPRVKTLLSTTRGDIGHQDYRALVRQLPTADQTFVNLKGAVGRLQYLGWIPGLSTTFRTARQVAAAGVDLGAAGNILAHSWQPLMRQPATSKIAELRNLLGSFSKWQPALNRALPNLEAANRLLASVNFQVLPKSLDARSIESYRSQLVFATNLLSVLDQHPQQTSAMLGLGKPARYLLVLENGGELRAGGGFITAYGYLTMNDGIPERTHIQAISVLQKKIQYHPPTPWPINNFWPKLTYWGVRDAAISPDMPTNARVIERFYDSVPHHLPIDGVVFVDSWLADSLIQQTGSLHLGSQYSNQRISAAHANVALEYVAERLGAADAKSKVFLGTLTNELRGRFLHASPAELVRLLSTVWANVTERHLAVYFNNPAEERLGTHWGLSNEIPRTVNGDYFSLVNDNLGAHKDNFFLETAITTSLVTKPSGLLQQTVHIQWTMPAVAHGWLVVPYLGWADVFVPSGAHLISATVMPGSRIRVGTNTSLNKTVYGMRLDIPARTSLRVPPTTASETLVYTLPKGTNPHRLMVQKQEGVYGQTITITDGSFHQTYYQTQNLELKLP